jgi:hypothetical protein
MRHKYNAVRTECDGIKFPSKSEARRYNELKALKADGQVITFLRQVPFHLPGGVKYVVDYLVFWADGRISFEDVKGMETPAFKAKRKMVEQLYAPITIDTIKYK